MTRYTNRNNYQRRRTFTEGSRPDERYTPRSRSSRRLHEGFTTSEKRTLQEGRKELLNAMNNTSMIEAVVEGAVVDKDIEKRDEIRSQCNVAYNALSELYVLLGIWGEDNGLWD